MLLAQSMAPRSSGFLEEHFTLSVATRTAKTGKDWKCKYCDYLGKAWDGPARGKAHLAGRFASNYPCMRWLQKKKSALQSAVVSPDWAAT